MILQAEMTEAVKANKRKSRGGHRAYVNQVLPQAKELVAGQCTAETRPRIAQLKASLEEQLTCLRQLDEEILRDLVDEEGVTDGDIAEEVQVAGNLKGDISATIAALAELLKQKPPSSQQEHPQSAGVSEGTPATIQNVRVKLPKLEVKRFNGKIEEWQEFWDCYESSIHSNTALSSVDKFSYLRGLLGGAAKTAISGLALTTANYQVAIDLLKDRFGKAIVIERAHVNDLLNVNPVYHDKDTAGLRRLYDTIEVHHRGLRALNVDASTYEGIVVPAIIGKLPEGVRLQITRGKKHHEWKMEDLLKELLTELELKEEHCTATRNPYPRDKDKGRTGGGLNSASALLAKTNDFCAYCKGGHAHQDCANVKSVEERRQLLRKYGRCFVCARKGHISRDCRSKLTCNVCMGKHHVSICYKGNGTQGDQFSSAPHNDRGGSVHSDNSSHAFNAQPMGSGGGNALLTAQTVTSPTFHVGAVGRVALQTAQAVVRGNNESVRVRVLFDAGSHRSFITTRAVKMTGAPIKGKEWIEISTFSQRKKRLWVEGGIRTGRVPSAGGRWSEN